MKKTIFIILLSLSSAIYCSFAEASFFGLFSDSTPVVNSSVEKEAQALESKAKDLNPNVLKLALNAYSEAQKEGINVNKPILTVIDYPLPSSAKRMWVLDLENKKVLFNTLVAHGKYSGEAYSTKFSDDSGSLQSSLGVFLTENTYSGHNGYTLKIKGLEPGFNSKAEARHIVIHGAHYVSEELAKLRGAIGRSWGCPALDPRVSGPVINTIKDGSLVVAYYPDKKWLKNSKFIVSHSI